MKKAGKIACWTIGVVVATLVVGFMTADIWVSNIIHKNVSKAFAEIPDVEASIGDVHILFFSGTAIVEDIHFATKSLIANDSITPILQPGLSLDIPTLTIGRVSYLRLLQGHQVWFLSVSIDNPTIHLIIDEKHPESFLPMLPKDTTLSHAGEWLSRIDVRKLSLDRLCARVQSTRTPLDVQIDSLTIDSYDLAYDFADSTFHYNDSVYSLSIASLSVMFPDGLMSLSTRDFQTSDQGALQLGQTRIRNTVSPKRLADKAKEPTTWIDMEANCIKTSVFNPIRKILTKDYTLQSLSADVKRLQAYRDERYDPKEPFGMPQEYLQAIPVTFEIEQVDASVQQVDVHLAKTETNCGEVHMSKIKAELRHVTNKRNAVWSNKVSAPIGDGHVDAQFAMHMDKACTFDVNLHGTNVEANILNSLVRPLVGMTFDCHIDQIDATYQGDRVQAQGEFCLQYHGLNVQVHKQDDIPYKIVTKYGNTITQLANTLIPKSNPTSVDIYPRSYSVQWKRDEWKPFPLYVFGPCIIGAVETMLPGLYVHKQVKKN